MIKNNKWKAILSSVIILLPTIIGLIFWNQLPDNMTVHWGADGNADGLGSKAFAVFAPSLLLLVTHWICLLITSIDKKQKDQNQKALFIIFWILPLISLFANGIVYSSAFGKELRFEIFMPALLGIIFVILGNYLPKIKQNYTLGIKLPWTFANEENWNLTHRFCGKVWVVGGFVTLLSIFLPMGLMIGVTAAVLLIMIAVPFTYSYWIYRKHIKAGIVYDMAPKGKSEKISAKISAVVVALILVFVAVIMFTGNVEVNYDKNSFEIEADYWSDFELEYNKIDTIEYHEDFDAGVRTYGLGTARLSVGTFSNDTLGSYTRYAYTVCSDCVVIKSGDYYLVLNGKNAAETKKIFNTLSSKIEK